MRVKLLTATIALSLLGGCASVNEQHTPEKIDMKAVESKKREYPSHIRNGVGVEETNSWYLGNGDSFKEGPLPVIKDVKKVGWNLPDEAILKYKPKSNEPKKISTVEKPLEQEQTQVSVQVGNALESKISNPTWKEKETQSEEVDDEVLSQAVLNAANITQEVEPNEVPNEKPNKDVVKSTEQSQEPELIVKNDDVKPRHKYAYRQYEGDTDSIIIEASVNLPEQHNLDFEFHDDSHNLLDESRERLIHKAPLLLVYNKVELIGFYNKSVTPDEASRRAIKVRRELLRAGVNPSFVSVRIEQGGDVDVSLRADQKNDVKIAYVEFIGQSDQFETEKLGEFLDNFAPNATKWVRISAGVDAHDSLGRALRVKDLLSKHGIDRESVTILHRQEPIKTVKTLIYFKEG